jgi:hypothetical protein
MLAGVGLVVLLVAVGAAAAVYVWSGATLKGDSAALARVRVETFGGTVVSTTAHGRGGRTIPLTIQDGRLTPRTKLVPGEQVTVDVVVRRPKLLRWALGDERRQHLTTTAPVAHVAARYLKVGGSEPVRVRFDQPVERVRLDGRTRTPASPSATVSAGRRGPAGTLRIAAAARPWETLGAPQTVTWFPRTAGAVAVTSPAPGGSVAPATPLRLTFSDTVDQALGGARPTLTPKIDGAWKQADAHTLVFTPKGFGASFSSTIHARLPKAVTVTGPDGRGAHHTADLQWKVPPGSIRRLHELLAEAGYLPVTWSPAGATVARTPAAQVAAAVKPPQGRFSWRYPNTPPELKAQWSADKRNEITRGAVMKFQDEHGLDVDAAPGPAVWRALMEDAIKGRTAKSGGPAGGYSYVYVHRDAAHQTMTLWHNGRTVITSPGNTGVAAAPTALGTFPVFEHLAETTMTGTNPDGSHYSDPGIKWVSYFNGGDALHAFNRATFGTPQSVGCVELPLAAAAKIWPYTPIGTLVTIES